MADADMQAGGGEGMGKNLDLGDLGTPNSTVKF